MSDQIADQLTEALKAVENTSIPDDLRPVAFASAFWAARGVVGPPAVGETLPPTGQTPSSDDPNDPGDDLIQKIAEKLKISVEDVEFAYEVDGDDVVLAVPPSRLHPTKKDAIEQIVYVLAAGRQATGIETETTSRLLKAACDECGREDSNFSRILGALHGEGLVIHGSGHARTAKVRRDGYERATLLIKQLRGQGT
jgi:hypothetical protein